MPETVPVNVPAPGTRPAPAALVLDRGHRWSLTVLNVGLACCAVEAMAASLGPSSPVGSASPVGTVPYADGERAVEVLVVSGTVTDKLAPLVRRLYDELPGPVRVLSFGACANSGGPYWDSYCVTSGVDRVVPVDVWVPGCPPRPEALLEALDALVASPGASTARALDAPLVRPSSGPVGPQDLRARPL